MAIVTFSSAINTESNTLVEGILPYMNNPLEHNVYKPVNISHPSCLVPFGSYFCGSAGFSKFILIKMPDTLIFIAALPNLMDFLTECYVLVI